MMTDHDATADMAQVALELVDRGPSAGALSG